MKRKLMLIDHYQMLGRIVYWASKMDTSQLHTLYIMITKRGSEPRIKQVIKTKQKALSKRKTKSKKKAKEKIILKPGLHFVKINGVERKVRVLPNGKWRFEKMVTSLSTRRR